MSATKEEQYALGREALDRASKIGGEMWRDWLVVGETLLRVQEETIRSTGANDRRSYKYRRAINGELAVAGLDETRLDKGTRSTLLWIMERLDEIEAWRETLPEERRTVLASPSAIRQHYTRDTKPEKTDDEDGDLDASTEGKAKKPRPPTKAEMLNQQLEEAQAAIAEQQQTIESLRSDVARLMEQLAATNMELKAAAAERDKFQSLLQETMKQIPAARGARKAPVAAAAVTAPAGMHPRPSRPRQRPLPSPGRG